MLKIKILIISFIVFININNNLLAQPCAITLHECVSSKSAEGNQQSKSGKELNEFEIPSNEHALRMYIHIDIKDYKKIAAKEKLQLLVTTKEHGNEVELHSWGWAIPMKNQTLSTDCYFPAGEITLTLVDANDAKQIIASRTITVKPNTNKVANGNTDFPYDRTHFKIWTCKSIDDNWKPIDAVTKIKVGECINLFFESSDKLKNVGFMRWGIYKVKADGTEEYVNQKDQGIGQLELWRRLSYEECDEFRTPGIYRIYIATKDDADTYFGVNTRNYFTRTDLIVE